MKGSSYHERDYAFGQTMLTVRTRIGLTQAGLAKTLSVSRKAVIDWEGGSSYPAAKHLKKFLALAIQQGAFPAGRLAEEVRAIWQSAHQKVLFEVLVQLKPPPQKLFEDSPRTVDHANCLRFQLSPRSIIALAARVKRKGKKFIGDQKELSMIDEQCGERLPYERLLEDAMFGDRMLFTRQDTVDAAWAVVDSVLKHHHRSFPYQRGSWGPEEAKTLIAKDGGWRNPSLDSRQSAGVEQRTSSKVKDILGTD